MSADFEVETSQLVSVLGLLLDSLGVNSKYLRSSDFLEINESTSFSTVEEFVKNLMNSSGLSELVDIHSVRQNGLANHQMPIIAISPFKTVLITAITSGGVWDVIGSDQQKSKVLSEEQSEYITLFVRVKNQKKLRSAKGAFELFKNEVFANKRVIFEAVFATFVISLLGLVTAMYTMQVYDRVVPTRGFSTLWVLTSGVILTIVFEFVLKQSRAFIVDHTAKRIDLRLGERFFQKAMDIRLDVRPQTIGTFASQIRSFESVRNFLTSTTLFVLADAPFAILFILVIAIIAGPVAIVPIVMVPLAISVGLMFRKSIETSTAEHMSESNQKNGLMIEAIDGIETLKSVGSEWVAIKKFNELSRLISESEIKLRLIATKATNLSQLIQQLNYVGLIAVGAYLISTGDLTVGGLIACSIISGRALAPLAQMPGMIVQWKQAKIALDGLESIMSLPGDSDTDIGNVIPSAKSNVLSVSSLKFSYANDVQVIDVNKFDVFPGQKIAIVGPVGSGKSTLLKLLAALYKPASGMVTFGGLDMDKIQSSFLREAIVYLPQEVRLFNGTLRENLLLGIGFATDKDIVEASKKTGLDAVINEHPMGLSLPIFEGGRGLSGGQRQMVGLTRLLLMSPSIVLLDEPTSSMDGASEQRMIDALFSSFDSKVSIIVVTHKTALLPRVDRIVVVDKGHIVLDGDSKAVLQKLATQNPLGSGDKPSVSA